MKKTFFFALCALLVSCQKSAPSSGPADAVQATYDALNTQDSTKFIQSLTEEKRMVYALNPERVRQILDQWKDRHASIKVLSVQQNDSAATITYDLTVTGNKPETRDSLITHTYVEAGSWKHGY